MRAAMLLAATIACTSTSTYGPAAVTGYLYNGDTSNAGSAAMFMPVYACSVQPALPDGPCPFVGWEIQINTLAPGMPCSGTDDERKLETVDFAGASDQTPVATGTAALARGITTLATRSESGPVLRYFFAVGTAVVAGSVTITAADLQRVDGTFVADLSDGPFPSLWDPAHLVGTFTAFRCGSYHVVRYPDGELITR